MFCTFYGDKIVLLYHGYNKKADPSAKRQHREITKARKLQEAIVAENFDGLVVRAKSGWSEDVRRVYEAAASEFAAEVDERAELGAQLAAARRARSLTPTCPVGADRHPAGGDQSHRAGGG